MTQHQRPGVSDEHRIVPLRRLARAAIREAEEGAVRSCLFGHRWNRWIPLPADPLNWQTRSCIRCGYTRDVPR